MTLDDKRKVIEVLLCASYGNDTVSLREAESAIECPRSASDEASDESHRLDLVSKTLRVSHRYARQAYRMIESSPTLRREWFGAA